jgi:ABC-type dipeptide/oligopeptide/nickel transport system permease subunit
MRRLLKHRPVLVGLAITAAYVVLSIAAPLLPRDPLKQDLTEALQMPSADHWFGTDHFGRDLFTRVIHAGRTSLSLALLAVLTSTVIGVTLGLTAGYQGGMVDAGIMRVIDIMLAFPYILVAIMILAVVGPGFVTTALTVGVVNVPTFARMAHGCMLSVLEEDYVEAARSLGSRDFRIIFRHILPNIVDPLIVQGTYTLGTSVLFAGSLSFLGLGVVPPAAEWGAMISQGRGYLALAPHLVVVPGAALAGFVVGINMLGDGLRIVFDPRMRVSQG